LSLCFLNSVFFIGLQPSKKGFVLKRPIIFSSLPTNIRMKKITYLLLALTVLFVACNDDDDRVAEITLNHDGENVTAPNLPADIYEAAAQFTIAETTPFIGQNLSEVTYYMYDAPLSTRLIIYGGDGNQPGEVLYEQSLTGTITPNEWNSHVLSTPIEITGGGLWISLQLRHDGTQQSIGCDAGPTDGGGDWLFQDSDNVWRAFRQRTGESINWNIRGILTE